MDVASSHRRYTAMVAIDAEVIVRDGGHPEALR